MVFLLLPQQLSKQLLEGQFACHGGSAAVQGTVTAHHKGRIGLAPAPRNLHALRCVSSTPLVPLSKAPACLLCLLPAVQSLISVGVTVVTNDPPYPDHQTTYQRYMEAVE